MNQITKDTNYRIRKTLKDIKAGKIPHEAISHTKENIVFISKKERSINEKFYPEDEFESILHYLSNDLGMCCIFFTTLGKREIKAILDKL